MWFRESLDRTVLEQRQNKLYEKREYFDSYPQRDWDQIKEHEDALKQTQNTAKQVLRDSLNQDYKNYIDNKIRLVITSDWQTTIDLFDCISNKQNI